MEAAQVELRAKGLLRTSAQLADLELTQFVRERLAGVGDVAVDLGFDIRRPALKFPGIGRLGMTAGA